MTAPFAGRRPTEAELADLLQAHAQWRLGEGGVRADLARADLARANLAGASLAGANLAGANLAGADLWGANLARASLAGANLAGASLARADLAGANLARATGVLYVGPCDGWLMYAVRYPDGPRIHAGCRWFTRAAAAAHWHGRERKEHDERMMAGVAALCALGRADGWEGCE